MGGEGDALKGAESQYESKEDWSQPRLDEARPAKDAPQVVWALYAEELEIALRAERERYEMMVKEARKVNRAWVAERERAERLERELQAIADDDLDASHRARAVLAEQEKEQP